MQRNLVSAQLATQALTAIHQALQTVEENLSFLIDLAAEDRRDLSALGDRTYTFTQKALHIAVNHSDILPRNFDVEEFRRDLQLYDDLKQLLRRISPLVDKMEDTALLAGHDAYHQALAVYGYVKAAGKGLGLDELVADMKSKFAKGKRANPKTDL